MILHQTLPAFSHPPLAVFKGFFSNLMSDYYILKMVGFCYVLVIEIEKFHNFHVFHNVKILKIYKILFVLKIARLKVPCPQSGFLKSVTVSQYIDLQGRYRAAGAAK